MLELLIDKVGLKYRLGQKGFHGVELLFSCGVISFSKFDHRPSDEADFLKFRSL